MTEPYERAASDGVCRVCGITTDTPALKFLHEQLHADDTADRFSLKHMPYILCPRVAKLMEDFAKHFPAPAQPAKPWYTEEEVRIWLLTERPELVDHAKFITQHLQLAYEKGQQQAGYAELRAAAEGCLLARKHFEGNPEGALDEIEHRLAGLRSIRTPNLSKP